MMRNNRMTDVASCLMTAVGVAIIAYSTCESAPTIDRKIHEAIGRAIAKEAVGLLRDGGQISVITRDTEAFKQPALEVQMDSFKAEIRRAGATLGVTRRIQLDPLRPFQAPPGDFYELIRRTPSGSVIVSFMGPPMLTEEERVQLGTNKPGIVAFCPGNPEENGYLRSLFDQQLLHAAVVRRPNSGQTGFNSGQVAETFDQLYQSVTAAEPSALQEAGGSPK